MALITFSSTFGSGGSVVAAQVAERLGWNLYNRAIPLEVASRLSIPLQAALTHDEASDSLVGRLLAKFSVQIAPEAAGNVPPEVFVSDESFRKHVESILHNLADSSNCVIVGRAAAIVLGSLDAALHVRLDGDRNRRVLQAAEALNISIQDSTERLIETDRARSLYVRHFYRRDWADPRLYHMVLDSTVLSLDVCADLIIAAAVHALASSGPTEST
jgi:cytidylate kinase